MAGEKNLSIELTVLKHMSTEGKMRTYKTFVGPSMTSAGEPKVDNNQTPRMLTAAEMETLRIN